MRARRKLSRESGHRMAMLRNMVSSLIKYDRIKTTLPKAREARKLADKEHHLTVPKLFGEMAERYRDREGGYTRIHKLGSRAWDNAPMAILEYVDAPGDLKYDMLIKKLAQIELDPSLRVPTTFVKQGQTPLRFKREFKLWLKRLNGQRKFEKAVEKMMKAKQMTPRDLDSAILREIKNLRFMELEKQQSYSRYKELETSIILLATTSKLAREYGFTIKQETSSNKNVYVYCSREGVSESVKVGREAKRKRVSLRCDCKWRVVLFKNEQEGDQWEFRKSVNPQHSEHNHDLLSPEYLPTPWPPNVLQRIADHAKSELSTGDIRNAIQQEFPDLSWDERRFYNRLAEERDTEQRVANTIVLAARLASLACSNQEYTDKVYDILNNAFEDICRSAKIDPSSVYKENSSTQGDMTVISTSTVSNSDIICNYPAGTITVKNIPGQKGRPSKKNIQSTPSPVQSYYQRETSATSLTSDSSTRSPLPRVQQTEQTSHPDKPPQMLLHESIRPHVQPQREMEPSSLNFQDDLTGVLLPAQSQLPAMVSSHLHFPSKLQECVRQEETQPSPHSPTGSLSSSQLQLQFTSQPISLPYSRTDSLEETNFEGHPQHLNQLGTQMLPVQVQSQQFLSQLRQKVPAHPTTIQFSNGCVQFQSQLSSVRKEPYMKVESASTESTAALEQAKETDKTIAMEHFVRLRVPRVEHTMIGKVERGENLTTKIEQRYQQRVTHAEPTESHNEVKPGANIFLESVTKIPDFAGVESVPKIVGNPGLDNEVTIVGMNDGLDTASAATYDPSPTTINLGNGDDSNFSNHNVYHSASQRIFTQPLVPVTWMQNYHPSNMTWYADHTGN
ncbi:13312_t:CDS:2 [Acaulospora colombiana]|uniref:13312_t:CDS:1 n=1 Tax=Acaulospora colombiana TaxID=27376 RepID=A0ACA9JZ96_9GLOM|nr:13312_t:CDS:2 [Acaulospora colombiana]